MWRIRKKDLENAVEWLNHESKGVYGLDSAYGKWQLVRFSDGKNRRGTVIALTRFMTKRELLEAINTILVYLAEEKRVE